jgi:D-alanyl-D-alanine carboxypeptidase
MMGTSDKVFLDGLLKSLLKKDRIFSAVLRVESGDGRFSWTGATGNMNSGSRYFIASVTKLYITAVVMRLIEGKHPKPGGQNCRVFTRRICSGTSCY